MIEFEQVSVSYAGATGPVLADLDLHVAEGELCLVLGRTGTGKSTLLRAVNGLVPHFTGGRLAGRVLVAGRDTRTHRPRDLADVVGMVGQDPAAGFVTDVVEEELAYGMESLGLPGDVMRRRVEDVLDLLGLAGLRDRPLAQLSAGEQQRVAIGSVLTTHPRALVLDEPTSALDPGAAEEVLATLQRLVHDLGLTVLLAEHRLERVVQYADRVVYLPGGGRPAVLGPPAEVLAAAEVVPPVVELGRLLGWSPLPISVRDARRLAGPLREQLRRIGTTEAPGPSPAQALVPAAPPSPTTTVASVAGLSVRFGWHVALREVDLQLRAGEVIALMGRNGAGKTTLLRALAGLTRPVAGQVRLADPQTGRPPRVGLVPATPADLLFAETVAEECASADADAGAPPGRCAALLEDLVGPLDPATHPRDLSEGQRLGLVLAIVLAADPQVLLLDEPTRGLDYAAKAHLVATLSRLAEQGRAVLLATHDVELAAEVADRTVVLAEGEVVADGPTREVVTSSPAFAPQVAKVLAPLPWLTVADVAASLELAR